MSVPEITKARETAEPVNICNLNSAIRVHEWNTTPHEYITEYHKYLDEKSKSLAKGSVK